MHYQDIKRLYFQYFINNEHNELPGSSLVPIDDNSILFTTAGMLQFKNYFLNPNLSKYKNVVTSQLCFRSNDISNIGKSKRHNTLFEMLGNFSFGGYFKKEAIEHAWKVTTEVFKLDPQYIYISIHESDTEALELWKKLGVPDYRLVKLNDNFWGPINNSGPCGRCTELYYDLSESNEVHNEFNINFKEDRFIEFWNIVFNEFDETKNGRKELKFKGIDTGLGINRLAMIKEKKDSVYDTTRYQTIINSISKSLNSAVNKVNKNHFNLISDHIFSILYIYSEDIIPTNEGRGYILRKIIRRTILSIISILDKSNNKIVNPLKIIMKDFLNIKDIHDINILDIYYDKMISSIMEEESKFNQILSNGYKIAIEYINSSIKNKHEYLDNDLVYKLYDTYGFPIDITIDIANSKGIKINHKEVDKLIQKNKNSKFALSKNTIDNTNIYNILNESYTNIPNICYIEDSNIILEVSIIKLFQTSKEDKYIIFDKTNFYPESGGQEGDTGKFNITISDVLYEFSIIKTFKYRDLIIHKYIDKTNSNILCEDNKVFIYINKENRFNIECNHSSTHILNLVLRENLSSNITQKGSYVNYNKFRFDFNYNNKLNNEIINNIELKVNEEIFKGISTEISIKDKDEAFKLNAIGIFKDKYKQNVRVVQIGRSIELCGGSHVKNTCQIGGFKIIGYKTISSGIKRIEAVTHKYLISLYKNIYDNLYLSLCKNITKQNNLLDINNGINLINKNISRIIEEKNSLAKIVKKEKDNSMYRIAKNILVNSKNLYKKNLTIITYIDEENKWDIKDIKYFISIINEINNVNIKYINIFASHTTSKDCRLYNILYINSKEITDILKQKNINNFYKKLDILNFNININLNKEFNINIIENISSAKFILVKDELYNLEKLLNTI